MLWAVLLFAGTPPAATQDAPVVLTVSVDHSADARLVQGRPALVVAQLLHRQAFTPEAEPVTVVPVGGGWAGAFRLDVADAQGQPALWPFEAATAPAGAVQVTGEEGATWAWALSSDATAALVPGAYTLRLTLDAMALGLTDDVSAPMIEVTVEAAPSSPTADDVAAHALRVAEVAAARGRTAEALAALEALVTEQPFHVGARLRQALLLRVERPVAALAAVLFAVEGLPEADGAEPPAVLYALQNELVHAVETATEFEVTLAEKPPTHPLAGRGSAQAFELDGISGREVVLRRGVTYTFRLAGVPAATPFGLATDEAGAAPYTAGVVGAPASDGDLVTVTPDEATPAVLYYGSPEAPYAGWRLHVETATPTADEPDPWDPTQGALALSPPSPNPTHGPLTLHLAAPVGQHVEVAVFDVLGRRVAVVYEGATSNPTRLAVDASGWPAGTYIVRAQAPGGSVSRLVVRR
ncbi:T9SS type A sorting domain-containing protein [Rubrivirga marina]|uniref:Secretion system C-terminal sorting domain-containing protein n=1 Tax=Rubrivirga marina TaxID=1196024 RepID=A0A271IWY8_9BACT|nr:T9SS type A sorting domain-containing protein [Rubrivirga marina]PAP75059.1 hypothetical protein BSZ37_00635 [Rubrivirga marina]